MSEVDIEDRGDRSVAEFVESDEIEDIADEFESDVAETFDVDPEDIHIEAEVEPVAGADHDLVNLSARWVA